MIALFALQLAVPLILIAWIGIAPQRSLLGFCAQVGATAIGLFAAALSGIWMLPPWWSPYVYAALLSLTTLVALRRRGPFVTLKPTGLGAWAVVLLHLSLGGLAGAHASRAVAGRDPPADRMVELSFPLAGGTFLIVNGGSDPSVNGHMKTLDASVPRFRAWRGQSYGIDVVKVDRIGLRGDGVLPADPGAYRIYGAKVKAPCSGSIVSATDGLADMRVPAKDTAHLAGNHLILSCDDVDVVLGHLRPGTLKVVVGDRVRSGDLLAEVGNSGNSDEPHLHMHAQEPGTFNEPMAGNPLPMRVGGRFLVRNDRVSIAAGSDEGP